MNIYVLIGIVVWLYLLSVMKRSKLSAFLFYSGKCWPVLFTDCIQPTLLGVVFDTISDQSRGFIWFLCQCNRGIQQI